MEENSGTSAGHQLGQIVGNWYEQHIALPIIESVAERLDLYCDSRFKSRSCRGEKIIWTDVDANEVDYDFVLELEGSTDHRGLPVAFFETAWRRGSRHSKDKARDDSGKLVGMRDAYPTARHLGMVVAGEFTQPAQTLVRSRGIDLFYISKDRIVDAWQENGIQIDYPDSESEIKKRKIVDLAMKKIESNPDLLQKIASTVFKKIGKAEINAFESRVAGKIGATPQTYEVRLINTQTRKFLEHAQVEYFLQSNEPADSELSSERTYGYEVVFGDGDIFARDGLLWNDIFQLHKSLDSLVSHMNELLENRTKSTKKLKTK